MTEKNPDYVTEALEMIGLTEPKQIIQEVSGFVPVFDALLQKYDDHITALVFGRRWQYCRMKDGVCTASLDRIAKDLKLSPATVMRHTEKLVNDGYLIDLTPNLRNVPHSYADAGLIVMKSQLSATVSERNTSISQRKATVSESQLIKDSIRQDKKSGTDVPELSSMSIENQIYAGVEKVTPPDNTLARRVDFANIVAMGTPSPTEAREIALAFQNTRDITLPVDKAKGQRKAIKELLQMGVRAQHVKQAVIELVRKRMTITDLFSVAKTAIDIANSPELWGGEVAHEL